MSTTEHPPTPLSLFYFFQSLREDYMTEDDYSALVDTVMMSGVIPPNEMLESAVPFFHYCQEPNLFVQFQSIMRFAEQSSDFSSTLTTVASALPLLYRIEATLEDNTLFAAYLDALAFDKPSASHQEVMRNLQQFLDTKCDEETRIAIKRVSAEAQAADELGLSDGTLNDAYTLLEQDTALYIDILSTFQLNIQQNLPWDTVVEKIKEQVLTRKPHVWKDFEAFLEGFHMNDYNYTYNYETSVPDDYGSFCEQYLDAPHSDNPIVEDLEALRIGDVQRAEVLTGY